MRNGKNTYGTFFVSDTPPSQCGAAGGWIRTLREGEADYGKYTSGSSGWRACARDAAVVFKWSLEHGNSIIHGLETSSIHLDPSLPLSLQAPAPIVCLNGLLPPHLSFSPLLRLIVIPSAILSPHFSYLWTVHC